MIEAGLFKLFADDATLAGILGSGSPPERADGTSGIFPVTVPEAAPLPALAVTTISGSSEDSHSGRSRLEPRRIQIDCYAANYPAAKAASAAVQNVLDYRGELDDGSRLEAVATSNITDAFEEAPFVFRVILDFSIWFSNPA